MYQVRSYKEADALVLLKLFCDTIHIVNSKDYSPDQIQIWGNFDKKKERWKESFQNKDIFICESNHQIVGFCELEPSGHIDRFYIAHTHIGKGVGKILFHTLKEKALTLGLTSLSVEASITARPFFEKMGFSLVKEQVVYVEDILFKNFIMSRNL